jgi:hypothetical protein
MSNSCKHCGVVDLVSVEMKDRENGPISDWVQEFCAVLAGR